MTLTWIEHASSLLALIVVLAALAESLLGFILQLTRKKSSIGARIVDRYLAIIGLYVARPLFVLLARIDPCHRWGYPVVTIGVVTTAYMSVQNAANPIIGIGLCIISIICGARIMSAGSALNSRRSNYLEAYRNQQLNNSYAAKRNVVATALDLRKLATFFGERCGQMLFIGVIGCAIGAYSALIGAIISIAGGASISAECNNTSHSHAYNDF